MNRSRMMRECGSTNVTSSDTATTRPAIRPHRPRSTSAPGRHGSSSSACSVRSFPRTQQPPVLRPFLPGLSPEPYQSYTVQAPQSSFGHTRRTRNGEEPPRGAGYLSTRRVIFLPHRGQSGSPPGVGLFRSFASSRSLASGSSSAPALSCCASGRLAASCTGVLSSLIYA